MIAVSLLSKLAESPRASQPDTLVVWILFPRVTLKHSSPWATEDSSHCGSEPMVWLVV